MAYVKKIGEYDIKDAESRASIESLQETVSNHTNTINQQTEVINDHTDAISNHASTLEKHSNSISNHNTAINGLLEDVETLQNQALGMRYDANTETIYFE